MYTYIYTYIHMQKCQYTHTQRSRNFEAWGTAKASKLR